MKLFVLPLLFLCAGASDAPEIPERPELLVYRELRYALPEAPRLRSELHNGIPVYAMPDRLVPLTRIELLFRGGTFLEPTDKAGLASVAGDAWRFGGAGERTARSFDERLDSLAAELTVDIGGVGGQVTLDVLSSNLEPAMALLMDLIDRPRFQSDRFDAVLAEVVNRMRAQNDDPADIANRLWQRLVYGREYWLNKLPTRSSLEAIDVADCRRFIASLIGSGNIVVAASGDFDPDELRRLLDRTLGRLPAIARPIPQVPPPHPPETAGSFVVDLPDIPQCFVHIGRLGLGTGHPDEAPLTVFNWILGGGDFASRLVQRMRSERGLAYGVWSEMTFPATIPGRFEIVFQSDAATCAEAVGVAVGELEAIRSDGVDAREVENAVRSLVDGFPDRFGTADSIVGQFAADELVRRPVDYWTGYRTRIRSVTAESVAKAVSRLIDGDRLIVLVVGDIGRVLASAPDADAGVTGLAEATRLPLLDPMTRRPVD